MNIVRIFVWGVLARLRSAVALVRSAIRRRAQRRDSELPRRSNAKRLDLSIRDDRGSASYFLEVPERVLEIGDLSDHGREVVRKAIAAREPALMSDGETVKAVVVDVATFERMAFASIFMASEDDDCEALDSHRATSDRISKLN